MEEPVKESKPAGSECCSCAGASSYGPANAEEARNIHEAGRVALLRAIQAARTAGMQAQETERHVLELAGDGRTAGETARSMDELAARTRSLLATTCKLKAELEGARDSMRQLACFIESSCHGLSAKT